MSWRVTKGLMALAVAVGTIAGCATKEPDAPSLEGGAGDRWCDQLPREVNLEFERDNVDNIQALQIWSAAARQMVPMRQVLTGFETGRTSRPPSG